MRATWGLAALFLLAITSGCPADRTEGGDAGPGDAGPGLDGGGGDGAVGPDANADGSVDAAAPIDVGSDAAEPCVMPGTVEHLACGHCGTQDRFCAASGIWAYGPCTGEHGVCTPGDTSTGPCGACGTQTLFCQTTCEWMPLGSCVGETGMCVPGSTTRVTTGCPAGQSRTATCDATCALVNGPCEATECTPGATTSASCGMCGTQTRTCDSTGHWVNGMCTGEGVCMPGAMMTSSCGVCGTQNNTCDATCHWAATGMCTGSVSCAPRPSPTCVDASTLRTYGAAACVMGACDYPPSDRTCVAGCAAGACIGGASLLDGFGGATGFGPSTIGPSDDGSSAAISLTPLSSVGFRYYGHDYTSVFVNNNGNLTFGMASNAFAPMIPGAPQPMIAGLWGDVDTTGGGQPMHNDVVWFADATRIVATWYLVGYYQRRNDLENSFQIVLTPRTDRAPGDFDVELRFAQCEWHSTSTGGPAASGFDAGDHTMSLALPGSGMATVLDLCATSNVGTIGVWRYEVRGGIPVSL
jgi:hypothetical protein